LPSSRRETRTRQSDASSRSSASENVPNELLQLRPARPDGGGELGELVRHACFIAPLEELQNRNPRGALDESL
jgi:hypothetical protein